MKIRQWALIPGFVLVAMLGYWLATTAMPRQTPRRNASASSNPQDDARIVDEKAPRFRRGERMPGWRGDPDAARAGALEGQRVLVFKDADALARFLARMGDRVTLLGLLDPLNALRVGFSDEQDLAALLNGDEQQSFIFPVNDPPPPEGTVQADAVALGNRLREWLGISGDSSAWGKGVRIAILDTGVSSHSAFDSPITSINLVDPAADPSLQNGHGTAVASVIIGNDSMVPGVAPGAEILSIRIAGDDGQSDSFLLAKGIVAAVDAGVKLINISMGSFGDSALVRNAVEYARDGGALIIAAAGNNGIDMVSYPAAYEDVIAVGGVDALGNHLDFSNFGSLIDIAAPGYGVNAAWTGDQATTVSGTSFSSPIIAGAIATIMTQAGSGNLTPAQAYQLLTTYLNDGETAGKDPGLGAGMPDIGRVLNGSTPGIYDAAVASNEIIGPSAGNPNGQIAVLVQNRGTETLINTAVEVSTGAGTVTMNITSLAPNAVRTVYVPIQRSPAESGGTLRIDSRVVIPGGLTDVKPSNDRRIETYVPAGSR